MKKKEEESRKLLMKVEKAEITKQRNAEKKKAESDRLALLTPAEKKAEKQAKKDERDAIKAAKANKKSAN
jgi:hypothetical protein